MINLYFLGDSFIDIEGNEKEVLQFLDDISQGKINLVLSTKSIPEITVQIKGKNLKNF